MNFSHRSTQSRRVLTFGSSPSLSHRGSRRGRGHMNMRRARVHHHERGSTWGFFLSGIGLLIVVVFGGLLYITQVTGSSVEGYDVSSLERKVEKLRGEQQKLELEAAELQSLRNVQDRVERLNVVPFNHIAFTSPIIEGTIALHDASSP